MKTNTILLIIIGLLVTGMLTVAISGFVPGFSGKELNQEKNDKELPASEESFAMISSGSTGSGEVSVDLKPHKVSNGQLEVDISVNTHSVSLEKFNLKEITTLEFNGKSIRPVSAPSLTGHHNSGTLIFDVDKDMESFTIKILGIPKVEERIFEWRK